MPAIDYLGIVEEMSNGAFQHCSKMIFDCFDYKVMKQEEFRKVDLKEQLLEFQKDHTYYDKKKNDITDSTYANELGFYLDAYVKCNEGGRASKYLMKAQQIIKTTEEGNANIEDLIDLTRIYVSMMREVFPRMKNKRKRRSLSDIDFTLHMEDACLLKDMNKYDFKIPQSRIEKGLINVVPRQIRSETKEILTRSKSEDSKYFTYI